jgi:hypothetical protein
MKPIMRSLRSGGSRFLSSLATLASSMPAGAHNLTSSRDGIVAHYVRFQFEFIEAMF